MYGLASEIQRAASSIPANIAKGCGRNGDPELARFCQIAMGSTSELEYHLLLARDLKYLNADVHKEREDVQIEVKRRLASFIRKLRAER